MPRRSHPKTLPKRGPRQPSLSLAALHACRSKRRFTSEMIAQREIDIRELQQPRIILSTYHCSMCGGWHLTSS